jgi:hypothetical protein
MEAAERQLKHQYIVYCLGMRPGESNPRKRARVQCHTQAWTRYRGLVEKYQEGHLRDIVAGQPRKISCI